MPDWKTFFDSYVSAFDAVGAIAAVLALLWAFFTYYRPRVETVVTDSVATSHWRGGTIRARALRSVLNRVAPQPVYVGLNEAAMRLHEALEAEGLEDATGISCKTPEQLLEHYKYVLITQARERQITMEGTRQPSRVHRTIPPDDYAGLYPVPGIDILTSRSRADSLRGFDSVRITARELGNAIKERIDLLKRLPRIYPVK